MNERVFASPLGIEPEEVSFEYVTPGRDSIAAYSNIPKPAGYNDSCTGNSTNWGFQGSSYSLFLNQVSSIKDYQTATVR